MRQFRRLRTAICSVALLIAVGCDGSPREVTDLPFWQTSCDTFDSGPQAMIGIVLKGGWVPASPFPYPKDERRLVFDAAGMTIDDPNAKFILRWAEVKGIHVRPAEPEGSALIISVDGRDSRNSVTDFGVIDLVCWRRVETLIKSAASKVRVSGSPPKPTPYVVPH